MGKKHQPGCSCCNLTFCQPLECLGVTDPRIGQNSYPVVTASDLEVEVTGIVNDTTGCSDCDDLNVVAILSDAYTYGPQGVNSETHCWLNWGLRSGLISSNAEVQVTVCADDTALGVNVDARTDGEVTIVAGWYGLGNSPQFICVRGKTLSTEEFQDFCDGSDLVLDSTDDVPNGPSRLEPWGTEPEKTSVFNINCVLDDASVTIRKL